MITWEMKKKKKKKKKNITKNTEVLHWGWREFMQRGAGAPPAFRLPLSAVKSKSQEEEEQ